MRALLTIIALLLGAGCAPTLDTVRPVEPPREPDPEQRWPSYVTEEDLSVLTEAERRIEYVRKGELLVRVRDAGGFPAEDVELRWEQLDRDVTFGVDAGPVDLALWGQLIRAGVDQTVAELDWRRTEPEPGAWRVEEAADRSGLNVLPELGVGARAAAAVWMHPSRTPEALLSGEPGARLDAVAEHTRGLVERLAGRVAVWEAVRDPSLAWAGGNADVLALTTQLATEAIRSLDPVTPVAISYTDPLGSEGEVTPGALSQRLREAGVDYDVIGLAYHYNGYTRGGEHVMSKRSLGQIAAQLSELATFDKAIHVIGVSAPAAVNPRDDTLAGYWGRRWSRELQATWLKAFYTVALAEPAVRAVTWTGGRDDTARFEQGGLFDDAGRPKPSFHALREVIASLHTTGTGTPREGELRLRGFGGAYRLVAIDQRTGRETAIRVRLRERELRTVTLTLPESWL